MSLSPSLPARSAGVHCGAAGAAAGGAEGASPGEEGELLLGVWMGGTPWRGAQPPLPHSVPCTSARSWMTLRRAAGRWSWGWRVPTSAPTPPWPYSWHGRGCSAAAARVRQGDRDRGPDPTGAPEASVGCLSCLGLGELKEVLPSTELLGRTVPLAPAFQLTDAMIQGAVWPCQEPPMPCCRA